MLVRVRRWIATATTRAGLFVLDFRWVILSVVLAVVGLLSIFLPVPLIVNIGLAVVSLALVVADLVSRHRTSAATQFALRSSDSFDDVNNAVADSKRFEFRTVAHASFLIDKDATEQIKSGNVSASLGPTNYVVRSELRLVGRVFRRRYLGTRPSSYNGAVLGLDTDFGYKTGTMPSSVRLISAKYFDHVASDLFAMRDVRIDRQFRPEYGRNLFVDREGTPRDFGDSWLLNAVGTSVIALTSDGKLVVVLQSERNDSSAELYAPSGSGSLEAQDFRGSTSMSLDLLAINGAVRELSEEAGILESEIRSRHFLGFGRWLDKAAKPELLSLVFLTIDSHEVAQRRVPAPDHPFTRGNAVVRFAQPSSRWNSAQFSEMLPAEAARLLSVPLAVSLVFLADIAREPNSALAAEIEAVTGRAHF